MGSLVTLTLPIGPLRQRLRDLEMEHSCAGRQALAAQATEALAAIMNGATEATVGWTTFVLDPTVGEETATAEGLP